MIKVLYISPNGYLGGAERFVLTAALGHKVSKQVDASVLFFSEGEACEEARRDGLNYFVFKQRFRLSSPWKLFLALREIRHLVLQAKPDIIHATMPYSHIVLSLATIGLKIKKIWFQHGPVGGTLDKIANFFSVDMLWYNSNDLKNRHHKSWPKASVKIGESIIKLGVKSSNLPHPLFFSSDVTIGTAGRICSWKGFHNIVKALGKLKTGGIELRPFKFYIAGAAKSTQDKIYSKLLVDLVKKSNLEGDVVFLEHLQSMDTYYKGLDIFIHSSVIPEPFGLVVAEAMGSGCLVMGSDTGGVRDLLSDGVTGITFSSTDENAEDVLAQKLSEVLSCKNEVQLDKYRLWANNGRLFVENNYSVKKMIVQIEDLYIQMFKD